MVTGLTLPTLAGIQKVTTTVNSNLDFTASERKTVTITLPTNYFILSAALSNSDSANVATRLMGINGNVITVELTATAGTPQDVDYTYTIHYILTS